MESIQPILAAVSMASIEVRRLIIGTKEKYFVSIVSVVDFAIRKLSFKKIKRIWIKWTIRILKKTDFY
jgi:hypothetical protein